MPMLAAFRRRRSMHLTPGARSHRGSWSRASRSSGRRSTSATAFPRRNRDRAVRTARRALPRWKRSLARTGGSAGSRRGARRGAPAAAASLHGRGVGRRRRRCSICCRASRRRLTLAFRDAGALDFTQGTLGALEALGSEERAVRPAARARSSDRSSADRRIPGHVVHAARASAPAHRGMAAR